ncbi:MAG: 50S ribosomal protein L4 [Chloroflexota bacterium]|nr:MAG: 50S ribosomal protein L4 [Chloroflexota bacterium]
MKLPVYNQSGSVVGDVEVDDAVFSVAPNVGLMHQAVVQQLANARVGTASTKTRAEVTGTTKKLYKQKGTGRARHGSRKISSWIGGGVAHGPHPRSYEQSMPKKMRRAAIRSALSVKARDGQIILLDGLTIAAPRTKDMLAILASLPIQGNVLLTLDSVNEAVVLSARNLPNVHTIPATALSTRDILKHDILLATVPAIRSVEQWLGNASSAESEAPAEAVVASVVEAPAPRRRARKTTETAE